MIAQQSESFALQFGKMRMIGENRPPPGIPRVVIGNN
jgi:hypothetical protein